MCDGLMDRTAVQLRQFICGLHGHDSLLHFERGRISLLCPSCGHETPGWEVGKVRQHDHAASQAAVQRPFVEERRVA